MLRIGLILTLHPSKGRAVNSHGFIEAGQQYQYLTGKTNPYGFTRIRMDSCPKRRRGWHY
jgi:hypothetical protein